MRLLHARSHTFKEFLGTDIPPYAIVSHRWGDDELSYQDFLDGKREGYGWTKIAKACELALNDILEWVWNDTICIDKKSSAELSEAINSMYRWYAEAVECVAFLPEVISVETCQHSKCHSQGQQSRGRPCLVAFHASTWFTRVWTLQELISPPSLYFFDAHFNAVGDRSNLGEEISDITGIPSICFGNSLASRDVSRWSVAQRMSWAAKRQSTRAEDIAYSLMGIFDVNMPLLYGEGGSKAFVRLQTEIIRKSTDESIFAWWVDRPYKGLLAPGPEAFAHSSSMETKAYETRYHYEMTNNGLHFSFPSAQSVDEFLKGPSRKFSSALWPLNCREAATQKRIAISVVLDKHRSGGPLFAYRTSGSLGQDGFVRLDESLWGDGGRSRRGFIYSSPNGLDLKLILPCGAGQKGPRIDIYFPQDSLKSL